MDNFIECDIRGLTDIADRFTNFYYGCEGDDKSIRLAFNPTNKLKLALRAIFSSDYGHWDAGQPSKLVSTSKKMIGQDIITKEDFRLFTSNHVITLHGRNNSNFWKGTIVEKYAEEVLNR